METALFWEEKYQAGATIWDRGQANPVLMDWLDNGRPAPCRILVPGCGYGHEVLVLARRGFEVWGVDFAPTPLRHLQARLTQEGLTAHLVEGDVREWQPVVPFDAIYEQACLCALAPADWSRYEGQLYRWLQPGGWLFALFMQTNRPGGPPYHCEIKAMQVLFSPARWQWIEPPPERTVPHPTGFVEYAAVLKRLG